VLKVLTDILLAVDAGDLSALVLLDLSAAFDAVDHSILLHRLDSYHADRGISTTMVSILPVKPAIQYVRVGSSSSSPGSMVCGVPQGSVLSAILLLLYCGCPGHDVKLHPHFIVTGSFLY